MGSYAPSVYRALNGIFCVYKPPKQTMGVLVKTIQSALGKELNDLPGRPVRQRVVFEELPDGSVAVATVPDLSDHPLVVGPRYQPEFFDIQWVDGLPLYASGVQVLGIGAQIPMLKRIKRARFLRVYQVEAILGRATKDFTIYSETTEQTTFRHVTHERLDRVLGAFQAGHRKNAFYSLNVDPQSQEAYELAAQGMVRPTHEQMGAVIYGLKCIHFQPPNFTIEIHCCNEDVDFMAAMVHEIGIELRASACCTKIRRIRYGDFTLDYALLNKEWKSSFILDNISQCLPLLQPSRLQHRGAVQATRRPSPTRQEKLSGDHLLDDGDRGGPPG